MANFDESTVLALTPNATFQSVGEGAVILMIDSGQLYTCNETTEAFLKAVDGTRTIGAVIDEILEEFEIDRETLSVDMLALAAELSSQGIVKTA